MEIKGLQRLSKNEWLYKLSGRLTEKLSKWVALLENASPEVARLITAKILQINPDRSDYCPPTISLKGMTEEQHIGILKAVVLCLQKEDYGIQNAGIWIMEQLVQEGCNLSLYKEMLRHLY